MKYRGPGAALFIMKHFLEIEDNCKRELFKALEVNKISYGHRILQYQPNKYFLTPHLKCTLFANNSVSQ
jgi:hypothetical protein